jgi:hypothetical protein
MFMIDSDLLEQCRSVSRQTGLSQSEQIRRGIRSWLESTGWPLANDGIDALEGEALVAASEEHAPQSRKHRLLRQISQTSEF